MDKYLDILGIGYGLSLEDIKKAYRKKAMEYHPDRNAGFKKEAEKKMKELNIAYEYIVKHYETYKNTNSNKKERTETNSQEQGTNKENSNISQENKTSKIPLVIKIVFLILIIFLLKQGINYNNKDSINQNTNIQSQIDNMNNYGNKQCELNGKYYDLPKNAICGDDGINVWKCESGYYENNNLCLFDYCGQGSPYYVKDRYGNCWSIAKNQYWEEATSFTNVITNETITPEKFAEKYRINNENEIGLQNSIWLG